MQASWFATPRRNAPTAAQRFQTDPLPKNLSRAPCRPLSGCVKLFEYSREVIRGNPKATWEYIFCSLKRSEPLGAAASLDSCAGERPSERWSLCFGSDRVARAAPAPRVRLCAVKVKSVLGSKIEGKKAVRAALRLAGSPRTLEKADVLSYRSRRGRQGQ